MTAAPAAPLDLLLARAVAAEPGMLQLEVTTGPLSKQYDVRDEAVVGRVDTATGKSPAIDLRHDDAVSRRHARFFRTEEGFFIEDLDSANSTLLNGEWLEPSSPARLKRGDVIELGELTSIRVLSLEARPKRAGQTL